MKPQPAPPFMTIKRLMTGIYGEPLYRVPIDPGFTCPNRGPDGSGGCAFCAEDGGRAPHIPAGTVEEQVAAGIAFAGSRYGARRFMAYVQAFTGTYAPAGDRRLLYRRILSAAKFDAISVGTRPDCLGEEELGDLAELRGETDVWVELGIQTVHDETLARIRRGHNWARSRQALLDLDRFSFRAIAHVIIGLPGENQARWSETADVLSGLPVAAVKIHNLHIIRGSELAGEYERAPFPLPDEAVHAEAVIDFIRRMPPSVAIARISTDTPAGRLIAPHWRMSKAEFREHVIRLMNARGWTQGDLFGARSGGGSRERCCPAAESPVNPDPAAACPQGGKPRILLHVCCGPCAAHCATELMRSRDVTLFFSNSNIHPRGEHERRLAEARKLAGILGLPLVEDPYDHESWLRAISGLESMPEKGARCAACFAFSLGRTAGYASANGFAAFTTTLTVSPHKHSPTLFSAGRAHPGFVAVDFKKRDGFGRSMELARRYGLYRQDYCGCEFSHPEKSSLAQVSQFHS